MRLVRNPYMSGVPHSAAISLDMRWFLSLGCYTIVRVTVMLLGPAASVAVTRNDRPKFPGALSVLAAMVAGVDPIVVAEPGTWKVPQDATEPFDSSADAPPAPQFALMFVAVDTPVTVTGVEALAVLPLPNCPPLPPPQHRSVLLLSLAQEKPEVEKPDALMSVAVVMPETATGVLLGAGTF